MTTGVAAREATPGGRRRGLLAWLLTERGFLFVWLAYVIANALIRYSLSHTLATDDAPESLLVQSFRLGYELKHSPLWEWLLWAIQQVTGPGFESHLIIAWPPTYLGAPRVSRWRIVELDADDPQCR